MNKIGSAVFLLFSLFAFIVSGCGEDKVDKGQGGGEADNYDVSKDIPRDMSIQEYNIQERKKLTTVRFPCDTIALMEYVLNNYPEGTYLVDFDRTFTYNIPKSAVIYQKTNDGQYVFGLIAKSWSNDHRLIEMKNIVGYDASFIDLDSTDLGTAFFYLTLFKCNENTFDTLWEAGIPSHGGFNNLTLEKWAKKNIQYIKADFHYGQGIGHFDYNFFFVDGMLKPPHLLLTYEGINFKRIMTDANGDKYPDYIEFKYLDTGDKITILDSITFIWKDTCYINTRNPKQFRYY
ncbi:MAG: hypothetical protein WCS69_08595 [Ignavibacteriaceae bacterium]|jgi:hypothetical protein